MLLPFVRARGWPPDSTAPSRSALTRGLPSPTPQHKQMQMLRCLLSAPGRRLASAYWRAPVRSLSGGGLVTALAVGVGGAQAACGDDAAFTSAAIAPEPPARMPGFGNVHVLRRTPYTVLRVGERERERECVCVCVCSDSTPPHRRSRQALMLFFVPASRCRSTRVCEARTQRRRTLWQPRAY